ncbi:hypothetical protein [Corynebacterium sp.]|jgi:hypothetical protein|uniref:hypothetical protein n=1 Tax=Corynebacterium sp. TaxID=1720 RepID=UPI0025BD2985|nr:hypothetical protein [Corynebacterium sp.]
MVSFFLAQDDLRVVLFPAQIGQGVLEVRFPPVPFPLAHIEDVPEIEALLHRAS